MESQIEKFEKRKKKTEELRNKKQNQSEENNQSQQGIVLPKLVDLFKNNKVLSDEEVEAIVKKWLTTHEPKQIPENLSANEIIEALVPAQTMSIQLYQPETKALALQNQQKTNALALQNQQKTNALALQNTVEDVEFEEVKENEAEKQKEDWKELKRKFWEEYAKKHSFNPTHDINNDEDTYTCSLTKKEADGTEKPLGLIYYASEFNAQVSKDADLVMYKGLVTDAAANNLSITFGDSLNDKQKALLLAAVLIHQNEENKQIKMIKEPQIDLNAPYFKELPQEAQDVLKKQAEIKNTKEKIAPQQPRATLNSTRLLMPHNKESGR